MSANRLTRIFFLVLFASLLFAVLPAQAETVGGIGSSPSLPAPDLNLTLAIDGHPIVASSTIELPVGATLPVSVSVLPVPGGFADWSTYWTDQHIYNMPTPDAFDGTPDSKTYTNAFYLDFYKGDLFHNATFVSGEQLNASSARLTTAATVTFSAPGTYSAVLYGTDNLRDYAAMCLTPDDCNPPTPISDFHAEFESGASSWTNPVYHFIGMVSFTVTLPDPCAAGGCVSNVLFLPGIEGSRLYEGTGCGKSAEEKLWDPTDDGFWSEGWNVVAEKGDAKVAELGLDVSGESKCADIYTKDGDVIDAVQGTNLYQSVMEEMQGLKAGGTIADWKPVAYDWRLSLDDLLAKGTERDNKIYYEEATSTPYIEQTLRALAASSKTGKVTIVAHSNGGLVAKALLHELGDSEAASLVDKVIMVAVPQTGAPSDVGSLLVGYGAGIYKNISVKNVPLGSIKIISNQAARTLSQNSPMAYHLLPSEEYFESTLPSLADHPVVKFEGDGYAKEGAAYGATIANRVALDDFILARDGGRSQAADKDLASPKIANASLVDYANATHDTLDAWVPPASIEVDQIAGWGVDTTVAGIDFYTQENLASRLGLGAPDRKYRPILVEDGDGTVPVPSALAMSKSAKVKRYWVDLANSSVAHGNIFENSDLRDFLKNILTNNNGSLPQSISTTAPITSSAKKLTFFLHSPLTLQISDASGNVTGIASDGSIAEGIPGSSYAEFGEVKYVTVPEGNSYSLTLHGQAAGTFSLDMQESLGGTVVTTSTIADVPTTSSTLASLSVSGGVDTASPLTVDEQGDGKTFTVAFKSGETVSYTPPAPAPVEKRQVASAGSISIPVVRQSVASTSVTVLATPASTTASSATTTRAMGVVSSPHNARTSSVAKKVQVNTPQSAPQLAAVAVSSPPSILNNLASGVYTGLHRLWVALVNFF